MEALLTCAIGRAALPVDRFSGVSASRCTEWRHWRLMGPMRPLERLAARPFPRPKSISSCVLVHVSLAGIGLYHWSQTQPVAGSTILAGQDR